MRVLNKDEFFLELDSFKEKITKGGVFVYPTDTIYGIGCNAKDNDAVKRIREMKERPAVPFSVIATSKDWILENCEINEEVQKWLDKLPGPYTIVLKLKNKKAISPEVNNNIDTVGIRLPMHWIRGIVRQCNVPIVSTSVNKTGKKFMTSLDDIDPDIKAKVDFIIDEGELSGAPSTIIRLEGNKTEITERKK